jgi:hypothetical protein
LDAASTAVSAEIREKQLSNQVMTDSRRSKKVDKEWHDRRILF